MRTKPIRSNVREIGGSPSTTLFHHGTGWVLSKTHSALKSERCSNSEDKSHASAFYYNGISSNQRLSDGCTIISAEIAILMERGRKRASQSSSWCAVAVVWGYLGGGFKEENLVIFVACFRLTWTPLINLWHYFGHQLNHDRLQQGFWSLCFQSSFERFLTAELFQGSLRVVVTVLL